MTDSGELRRENEALRERIARLSAAVLRISASLDVMTVLQEVVDRQRPRADRRPLRLHRHRRRRRPAPGLRHLRTDAGRAEGAAGVARRAAAVRAPARPSGPASPGRASRLHPLPWLRPRPADVEDPADDADAPPRRPCRALLSRREARRTGVHHTSERVITIAGMRKEMTTFASGRRRREFCASSPVRTHAQSRAQLEPVRARVSYTYGRRRIFSCDSAARRCAPVEAEPLPAC